MDQFVQNVQRVPGEFWLVLLKMSPYLLLGFFVAGVLSVLVSPRLVERHLGGRGLWSVVKASLFGVPLPLCSCGVIPVAASLRRHGASRGAATSFLISTPQTGVDSIAITYSLLGPVLMVFRPLVALVSGVLGGSLVTAFDRDGGGRARGESPPPAPASHEGRGRLWRMLHYGFVALPTDLARALVVGLVLAALITALVPADQLGGLPIHGFWMMLVMMVAGIPVYVCATASVPIAAALIVKGVSPGAAMVFLMTGPATNAATLATVWRTMGRRTAIVYLATVAACALGAGLLLDGLFPTLGAELRLAHAHAHAEAAWMFWLQIASAVALLAMLGYGLIVPLVRSRLRRGGSVEAKESAMKLKIAGMSCGHCARSVQQALLEGKGVTAANVDLAGGTAVVEGEHLDAEALCAAVRELGYEAKPEQ